MKRIPHVDESIKGPERAKEYAEHSERHAKVTYGPLIKDMKRLNPSGRCLEVGAGPAVLTCWFAREFPNTMVTALDLSSDMVDVGRSKIISNDLNCRVDYQVGDVGDGNTLGRLGGFDFVFSSMSMHHWINPQAGLEHLLAAVKPGGTLYIGDLRRVWWLYYLPINNGLFMSVRAAFLPREIKAMLDNLNVAKYDIRRIPPYFFQSITVYK
jgi:2-polyprenyl-3-methyl-5-hydroxy-6-metoxy-1,4-benzoquinol methylase